MWRYSSVARATGSYPVGRKFKSHCRYHIWPVGQAVKTPPFHGGITSSILVRVTKSSKSDDLLLFLFVIKLYTRIELRSIYTEKLSAKTATG